MLKNYKLIHFFVAKFFIVWQLFNMKQLKLKTRVKLTISLKQVFKLKRSSKILQFKQKYVGLTDDDILNLFVGLMNLIKNSATERAELYYRNKINLISNEINKKTLKLVKLEAELKQLKNKV